MANEQDPGKNAPANETDEQRKAREQQERDAQRNAGQPVQTPNQPRK